MRLVIAGASGFIGRNFIDVLSTNTSVQIRALSRNPDLQECAPHEWQTASAQNSVVQWRRCDLFSLKQIEMALDEADVALFLVHSMMPSSRLVQAEFSEIDLLLADNFARAAKKSSLKRIVFLGGMIPSSGEKTSEHLRSRQEVEHALAQYGTEVRVLRAGIVLGGGGSSSEMVFRLVEKLPVMVCPAWTLKVSSPVYIDDVIGILEMLLFKDSLAWCDNNVSKTQTGISIFEANSGETVSYRALMQETATQMKRNTVFIPFPYVPPTVSALWVSLISGYSLSLVRPLVKSLDYDLMPKLAASLPRAPMPPAISWREAIARALSQRKKQKRKKQDNKVTKSSALSDANKSMNKTPNKATSIQRMPCPADWSANRIAEEYVDWLPKFFSPFLQVKRNEECVSIYFAKLKKPLLVLRYSEERSTVDRVLFYVVSGMLVKSNSRSLGRLEFRKVNNGNEILAAVLDFEPSLPWWIYVFTQALGHLVVMLRFKRHLRSFLVS